MILRLAERSAGLQLECRPRDPEPQVPPDFPQAWELSVMLPVGVLWDCLCVCVCVCVRERESFTPLTNYTSEGLFKLRNQESKKE